MPNFNRLQKNKEVATLDLDSLSLNDAINEINHLISLYGKDAKISKETAPYSDSEYLAVYIKEPESDIEYETRIALEAQSERYRDEFDRKEYARLKQKFEK